MNCCERKCNICYFAIIASLISLLLIWNLVLTIIVANNNNNNDTTDNCECYCVEQMTNIIEQIRRLYPDSQLFITLDDGDAVIGTPGEITLGPNGKSGIFELITSQGDIRQLISICSIDTITINSATYNEAITYLPEPDPLPTDCCADCIYTIRDALPVGTEGVSIVTNDQLTSQGNVVVNEPGMIVLENTERNNITFVSPCRIDVMYLPN